jgi:hypothetical protein
MTTKLAKDLQPLDHINFTTKDQKDRNIPMTDQVKSVENRGTHIVVITYAGHTLHYSPNRTVKLVEKEEAPGVRLGYSDVLKVRGVSVT